MLDTRIACPFCSRRLKMSEPVALGDRIRCPHCYHSFDVQSKDFTTQAGGSMPFMPPLPAHPETSPVVAMTTPFDGTPAPTLPAPAQGKGFLVLVAAGVLVLAIGAGVGIGLSTSKKKSDPESKAVAEKKTTDREGDILPPPEKSPADPSKDEQRPKDGTESRGPRLGDLPPQVEPIVRRDPPPITPPPPAHPWSTLPAEKQEKVNKAIEQGVEFLKKNQTASGSWVHERQPHAVGLAALPGLTLLECGVERIDPVVQGALTFVRRHAPAERQTYDISLCILFLDRYGDPGDRRLIQTLGLRLMAGQQPSGGWTYACPDPFTAREELVFFDILQQTRPKDPLQLFERDKNDDRMAYFVNVKERMGLTGRIEAPLSAKVENLHAGPLFGQFAPKMVGRIESTAPNAATIPLEQIKSPKTRLEDVPLKLRDVPILKPIPASKDLPGDGTDNSNTQFGILGVWAAARHNIPVERTLAMLVKRFRTSQNADGSWGYHYRNGGGQAGTGAMTGSGLLGLAVGHGLIAGIDPAKGPATAKDPAIQSGLKSLSTHLDETAAPPRLGRRPGRRPLRVSLGGDRSCYFLWSVERVGVLYNLPVINDSEWYPWGVDILLPRQQNGAWPGGGLSVGPSDTCLALLFLKRANLTHDLSTRINFLQLADKKD